MPSPQQHLEQARAFHADLKAQQSNAYAARVVFLHLTALHLVDTRLAQRVPPIHPEDHRTRNDLLRTRPSSVHGVPRMAVEAYVELLRRAHEVRYECPTPYRLERLHREALEEFGELLEELGKVGVML